MHIKKIIALVIPLVMAISLVVPTGINSETNEEEMIVKGSRANNNTDVPTWNIGDSWSYNYYIWQNMTPPDTSWIYIEQDVTYTVSDIGNFEFNGNTYFAYNLTLSGSVVDGTAYNGDQDVTITGLTGTVTGWQLNRVSDLALIVNNQTQDMEGSYWGTFYMYVSQNRYFNPPYEEYNFPIGLGEKFWMNSSSTIDGRYAYSHWAISDVSNPLYEEVDYIQENVVRDTLQTVNVPGGAFDTYYVHNHMNASDGSGTGKGYSKNWYNESVGNYVRQRVNITDFIDRCTDWIYRLTSYNRASDPSGQTITPSTARIGDTVTISGEFPNHPNEAITIELPEGAEPQSQWTTTTDNSGQYSLDITVPLVVDDTDAPPEFSSVGFVTTVDSGTKDDMIVSTLVIKLPEIALDAGWNFISSEHIPSYNATGLLPMLEHPKYGISGSYDRIMYYNSTKGSWSSYKQGRLDHFNSIGDWNASTGFWIYMNTNDTLSIVGIPSNTQKIVLHPGWNMVGYICDVSENAGGLFPVEVTKMGLFNISMGYNLEYTENLSDVEMVHGEAYWVYNSASTKITVTAGQ